MGEDREGRDRRAVVAGHPRRAGIGLDAHALHHAAKLLGSRYQDVVAKASRKVVPPKVTVHE